MKKFTKFIFPSLCAIATSFSVNASNNLDDPKPIETNPINYFPTEECYASEVVDFQQGLLANGNTIEPGRSNPLMALSQPDASNADGGFVSLGVDGYIILGFDGVVYDAPGDDLMIYETSFNGDECFSNSEKAMVELSQDGSTWVSYGEICLDEAIDFSSLGLEYVSQIKLTNTSETANSPDGYDIDGVVAINGCQELVQECYAAAVISYTPALMSNGEAMTNPLRINPAKALGEPENDESENFVSLGYGGEIVIGFDGVVMNEAGDDLTIFETTFGDYTFAEYPESADVFVSQNGVDFYFIGSAYTSQPAMLDIDNALTPNPLAYITQVKLVDTTPEGSRSGDGYDLDAVVAINGCSEAPQVNYATCSASELLEYNEGTTISGGGIDGVRTENPENVLGYPEYLNEYGVFTTLGYGGSVVLAFDGAVYNRPGADLLFVETSFNQTDGCGNYPEFADVYVSFDNYSWHMAGTVCKENNTVDISDAGNFEYINYVKVVNNDELSVTHDAYDLDGVIIVGTCNSLSGANPVLTATDAVEEGMNVSIYPNPVTTGATINFVASENGNANIELFNHFGRNVFTIFNQEVVAGREYQADFSAYNLARGIYICKITNNNITKTKKIIISN
ncbi:T9SS type A sorting domain-containing protein [Bizionia sp. KMM 8389]